MIKNIKFLLISLVMFFGLTLTVSANNINLTDKGSIKITLKEDINNMVKGAEISIYHIADAIELNNNLAYSLKDELSECNINLSDLTDTNLVNEISKCNLDNTNKYINTTNNEGIVKFDNLQLGLYLVKQTNNVEGYSNIDPFLVAIPTLENNIWIYNIEATPKTDIIRLMDIIVEKKWDIINGNNTPDKVLVQLLKKDEVIDTIILNNENNWTYTWKQIEASDEYSVKEIEIPAGYTATYRTVDNKFIITNTKTLVQTGQNILLIQVLVSIGLIFIITGLIINKRNNYE